MSKKIVYKSFKSKKTFDSFIEKAVNRKQVYELRYKGKKFRLGKQRKVVVQRAKAYARAAEATTPEDFVSDYLDNIKEDSNVTITIQSQEGKLYFNKLHRKSLKSAESKAAFLDLLDEMLERYEIDQFSIVGIKAKKIKYNPKKKK